MNHGIVRAPALARIHLLAAVGGLAFLVTCPAGAQQKTALPGATYESLTSLPNWSGWWGLEGPLAVEYQQAPAPLKPELGARMQKLAASDEGGARGVYCRPSEFPGYSGGFVESVEFLFTPGRVTLTNESGLVRRIYTDGRPSPQDVDATTTGTSVGRWEGQTLVVETFSIDPRVLFPQPGPIALPIGRNVKVVERISLRDANTLQFDISTTAPDIFTRPDKRTRLYSRVPKRTALQVSFCTDNDRAIDGETGKQRFDMTPPADLPPPPPAR
ncbi:MAG: hypothetical protein WDO56_20215 [Gammaproteobacteria bacterium]